MKNLKNNYFTIIIVIVLLNCIEGHFLNCALGCEKQKYFLITVDTETRLKDNFPVYEQFNTKINNINCGLSEMIRIADKFNAKITFYINVYEYDRYGDKVKDLIKKIYKSGHDIQLHTHPEFSFDKKRLRMFEYSYEEQDNILRYGKQLIEQWTGEAVVAHRAGTYSADQNTLKAALNNNIVIDSSYRYNYYLCKLNGMGLKTNALTKKGNILEIPVTQYVIEERSNIAGNLFNPYRRLKKFDIDSNSYPLLSSSLGEFEKSEIETITLFMHSWSFVKKWSSESNERVADVGDISKFEKILKNAASKSSIKFINTKAFKSIWENEKLCLKAKDEVPLIRQKVNLVTYMRRVLNINRKNIKLWVSGLFVGIVLVIGSVQIYRTKSKKE